MHRSIAPPRFCSHQRPSGKRPSGQRPSEKLARDRQEKRQRQSGTLHRLFGAVSTPGGEGERTADKSGPLRAVHLSRHTWTTLRGHHSQGETSRAGCLPGGVPRRMTDSSSNGPGRFQPNAMTGSGRLLSPGGPRIGHTPSVRALGERKACGMWYVCERVCM